MDSHLPSGLPSAAVAALRRTVSGPVAYPADPAYEELLAEVPPGRRPDVVVSADSEADVAAAVEVARRHGLPTDLRPDGPGILVLRHRMTACALDDGAGELTAEVGASWAGLVALADAHGVALPDCARPGDTVLAGVEAGHVTPQAWRAVAPDGFVRRVATPAELDPRSIVTAVVLPLAASVVCQSCDTAVQAAPATLAP